MNKTIIDKLARFAQTSAIIGLCLLGICPAFGIMAMVVPAVFKQKRKINSCATERKSWAWYLWCCL